MAITKTKKAEIIKSLQAKISGALTIAFVHFHGLPVAAATKLRQQLRAAGVGLTVAKKTLIRRAFADSKIAGELPALDGEIALAYSTDDPLAPARGVYEFEKQNKDSLKLVGGVYQGKFVDQAVVLALAQIPGRQILLGKLVNILNSPIHRLVRVLGQASRVKADAAAV